eukprot:CAMPEP_0177392276 /NCGR_PEP_ID=MMETSP0368-20130122/54287_1 /TAXON_ID=447022 ORGANISM="Scrippsiella hangoei-like, Strain SHHI-4" /NCGR_SAMPLE_ID=MMETSP0368 /ASSEMBLY_ACC=CAM_ASM_000363 /LENGTH=65 /DNA_ID=CAMNT_0018858293 /DNA_START=93 /DNA_END=287 /DNA_ORIENTATION=+
MGSDCICHSDISNSMTKSKRRGNDMRLLQHVEVATGYSCHCRICTSTTSGCKLCHLVVELENVRL